MGHGYIPKRPPFELYWCDNHQAWFKRDMGPSGNTRTSCLVAHEPGSCCHQGDVVVDIVERTKAGV